MKEIERRQTRRLHIALACTLSRPVGNAVAGTTVEVGAGGMSVTTTRPLAVDEELGFRLSMHPPPSISGRARVLRDLGHDVYGLRFERLPAQVLADLDDLCARETG